METTRFKKFRIGDVFNFPETNSKITKSFCNIHKGLIPVYASSKDENSTLGFIQDNLKGVKYYDNCLSWNRNGSVGYVFVRNHKFSTNEDHRSLEIKEKFRKQLDKKYLKFEIEKQLFLNGFSFLNKCGVNKIKGTNILIPVNKQGEMDLQEQIYLANKYLKIEKLKIDVSNLFNNTVNLKVDINSKYKTKSIPVLKLFDIKKGNSKYTKRFIHDHAGEYSVYSSQTSNLGEIGKINSYDYNEECFTWTTDGTYVGKVFYRNGKFSITTHCGILKIKDEYKGRLNFQYLDFIFNQTLLNYMLGEGSNKRLGIRRMTEISIEIPIAQNGEFDLEKQKEIADKYKKIEEIKEKLREDHKEVVSSRVEIIGS